MFWPWISIIAIAAADSSSFVLAFRSHGGGFHDAASWLAKKCPQWSDETSLFFHGNSRSNSDNHNNRCNMFLSLRKQHDVLVKEECTVVEIMFNPSTDNPKSNTKQHRFTAQTFASSNCWGYRPLLFRGAFDPSLLLRQYGQEEEEEEDNFDANVVHREDDAANSMYAWPSWEEVVEIATDVDSESRIISHVPGDHTSFELSWGPLLGRDMRAWISKKKVASSAMVVCDDENKHRRETLVVNDVDRFYPPLADWIFETFPFLPNWRMDDGQISLSEAGAGIGPHVDNYDVFLIQMSGTRTWQIGQTKISPREEKQRIIDGLDVRVLSGWSFNDAAVEQQEMKEWTVYPGDLLYLPPRVAHCGISLSDNCMTLSVGCRAPSVSDLVSKFAETLSSSMEEHVVLRYTDSELLDEIDGRFSPGELKKDAKQRMRKIVLDSLSSTINDDEWWDEFLGKFVTEQKRVRSDYPIAIDCDEDEDGCSEWSNAQRAVQNVLAGKGVLYQAEGIAFAYSVVRSKQQHGMTMHRLFVNGEMWQSESQSNDVKHGSIARIFQIVGNNRLIDRSLLLDVEGSDSAIRQNKEVSQETTAFLEELVSAGLLYGSDQ